MQGQILETGTAAGGGLILGDDGNRYQFGLAEWKVAAPPLAGMSVDYVASGNFAREIYPLPAIGAVRPTAPASFPQGNASSTLGGLGIACLCLGFFIPVLPTIAGLALGLIGASAGKRQSDHGGLVLSRVAWIGNLLVLLAHSIGILLFFTVFSGISMGIIHHLMQQGSVSI